MKESVSDIRVRVIKQQAERLRILSGQVEILKEELAMRVRKEGLDDGIFVPDEADIGTDLTYYEEYPLADGRTLRIPIKDTIISLTHLLGAEIIAPSQIAGTIMARWDVLMPHLAMQDDLSDVHE
tara:strand:+ start:56 stop:430 length:375 start_codon:yes stop_codon:yes gene_type:complete